MKGIRRPYLDLSRYAGDEKERQTTEALERREPLIYSARIRADDLLGDPDLLRLEDRGYAAGDIKSGAGEEGPEDLSKPKLHYAVQIALYADILERKGLSAGRRPFIWDIHGDEVVYDLDAPRGERNPTTLWQQYQECLAQARQIIARSIETKPAYGGVCKNCWWYSPCQDRLEALDDLTLLPELGRAGRDALNDQIPTISALAEITPDGFITARGKKTVFPGIGPDTLVKFHERAKLVKSPNARPYLSQLIQLPLSDLEIFFDIEVDPFRDFTYLHGFVERRYGQSWNETYTALFADQVSEQAERVAFAQAWAYLHIYYYSKYERTIWRKLRERYPDVCSVGELEGLFGAPRSVDLYFDVVLPATEWPTRDYSIKTLAKYLGFRWRDTHPSGAASIEWFHRWVESGDPSIRQRILLYNQDDCTATRVLLDGIRSMTAT